MIEIPTFKETLAVSGRLKLTIRDAITDRIDDVVEAENLVTTEGLAYVMQSFLYALAVNQNFSWGTPLSTAFGNAGDSYGVLGTSSTAATISDSALGNEIGRVLLSNAGVVTATAFELDYFFGPGQANGVITEAGMCMNATLSQATLTSALVMSTGYTHIFVNPFPLFGVDGAPTSLPVNTYLIIGYGSTTVQYCQLTTTLSNGNTTVNIAAVGGGSFTANANYPIGTTVAFGPNVPGQFPRAINAGILFDHTIFALSTTKTSAQTATLGLQVTFT